MLGEGHSTKSIAEELDRSPRTIETQRASIGAKLGIEPGELVSFAVRLRRQGK